MKFVTPQTEYARQDLRDRQEPLGIPDIREKKGPLEVKDHQVHGGPLGFQAKVVLEDLWDLKEKRVKKVTKGPLELVVLEERLERRVVKDKKDLLA